MLIENVCFSSVSYGKLLLTLIENKSIHTGLSESVAIIPNLAQIVDRTYDFYFNFGVYCNNLRKI